MAPLFRLHCSEDRLVALLDGELTLPDRLAVERHLGGCPRCAGLLARHEQCRVALAAELAHDAPVSVATEVHLNVRVAATGAGVLAGSVGALVVAGLLVQRHRRPRRMAEVA